MRKQRDEAFSAWSWKSKKNPFDKYIHDHRDYGPSSHYDGGSVDYWRQGFAHRENGPQFEQEFCLWDWDEPISYSRNLYKILRARVS
jgi:hypothetical protein